MDFGKETRRRTLWWRDGSTGGSAGWTLVMRRDDARSGGGTVAQKGQQDGLWRGDETTYWLVGGWQHGRVSRMDFGEETRRRTPWWRNGSMEGSAGGTLARRQDDALSGGGTAAREGQQDGLWQGDKTTHILGAERRQGRVSRMGFGEETR